MRSRSWSANRLKPRKSILQGLFRIGTFNALKHVHRNSLTVLNYHSIKDYEQPGVDAYLPNVSATPQMFARQMEFMKGNYNVISLDQLVSWLRHGTSLPPYAALITFDDGYYDNLKEAYPILKQNGFPALIFLATDYINRNIPFYWDYVSYCFRHTRRDSLSLASGETISWQEGTSRERAMTCWINTVKILPDNKKQELVRGLAGQLDVDIPDQAFTGICLTWDQVRAMSHNGIEFGAHTVHHPILTHISLSDAESEILESKRKVESEIGKPICSFAYPNGQAGDFSPEIINLVKGAGFDAAFTLLPGPIKLSTVRQNPLVIRRIFLGHRDTFPRFVAKLVGFDVLMDRLEAVYRKRH